MPSVPPVLLAASPPRPPKIGPPVPDLPAVPLLLPAVLPSPSPSPLPLTFEPALEPQADAKSKTKHDPPKAGQAARERLIPRS